LHGIHAGLAAPIETNARESMRSIVHQRGGAGVIATEPEVAQDWAWLGLERGWIGMENGLEVLGCTGLGEGD
jgi:hypothetical protein